MSITFGDVREFIGQLPNAEAVAQVQEAAAKRLGELDKAAYAGIKSGRKARINDSLRPAILRSLSGTAQERNRTGSRVGFPMDEESTRVLRSGRDARYRAPRQRPALPHPGQQHPGLLP